MLTHSLPICTYLILLVCHGSNLQSLQNAANPTDHAPITDNNLGQSSEMTLLGSKRGPLLTKDTISDGHLKSKESTQWEDQTLNKKLMQQKLDEKSKLKTNLNIYTVEESNGVLQDGGNHIGEFLVSPEDQPDWCCVLPREFSNLPRSMLDNL
uniref:Prolactin receptor n=1 Tax=Cacopsylla melanoneura TaxID=428564 RepID=A0A8D9E6Z7_9HEMI